MKEGGTTAGEKPGAGGGGGWKKPLFLVVLLLVFLPVAYYFSYVWWGRYLHDPHPYTGAGSVGAKGSRWKAWVEEQVYPVWEPLRFWDYWRYNRPLWSRCIESCSGAWVAEDGRVLEVRLRFREDWQWGDEKPWVEGLLRCEDDPRLDGFHFIGGVPDPGPGRPVLIFWRISSPYRQLNFGGGRLTVRDWGEVPNTGTAPAAEILGEFRREGESPGGLEKEPVGQKTGPPLEHKKKDREDP